MPERPGETVDQKADRNFTEILQETRVLQTGVQVLFAFLLTVPFQSGFADIDAWQRTTYLVALASSGLAAVVLVMPVATHRVLFGRGVKPWVVRWAHRAVLGGVSLLGVAVVSGLQLVVDIVAGRRAGLAAAGAAAILTVTAWLVVPQVLGRLRGPHPPT